jgi:hypothetical protein
VGRPGELRQDRAGLRAVEHAALDETIEGGG